MKEIKKNYTVLIISITALIIFLLFIGIIWKMGFLNITKDDSGTKILAASLVLIGGLFSSLITLVGLILKHSIDLRSIALEERNIAIEKDAENRLQVEAAIQSIGLLSTSSGQEVSDLQKTGVILSLGNLRMFSLALSLSEEMLGKDSISMDSYTWLINICIIEGDDVVKEQAVLCLSSHINKLLITGGNAYFPPALLDIKIVPFLPITIRTDIVNLIIDLIAIRSYNEWHGGILSNILQSLNKFWEIEETYLKDTIGIALYNFLKMFPEDKEYYWDYSLVNLKQLSEKFSMYSDREINDIAFSNGLSRMKNILDWNQNL